MAGEQGFTLWFTGLSGAGKTTITELVVKELQSRGSAIEGSSSSTQSAS